MQNTAALLFAAVAALAIRLVAILKFGPSTVKFGDAPDYISAAMSLCSTGAYPDRSSMPFFRAPGLPFFIAGATLCHADTVWPIKLALAAVDAISVVTIFFLAEELFRSRRVSILSAICAAIYPFFIAQVSDVQTEALFMCLYLAAILLALRASRTQGRTLCILAGVCVGLAALVRPVGLVLLPLLAGALAFLGSASGESRVRLMTLFAIGALLSLGPWTIRNEVRFHELILVDDAGGYNFWRGTSVEMAAMDKIEDPRAFTEASVRFETLTSPAIARQIDRAGSTPSSRSREWFGLASGTAARDPAGFASRLVRNALAYWRPWLNPQAHSSAVVAASGLLWTALYLMALMGWDLLRRRDPRMAVWCVAGALLFWISQIPFQVVSRFRIPVTDPFLIVFAAAWLASVLGLKRTVIVRR